MSPHQPLPPTSPVLRNRRAPLRRPSGSRPIAALALSCGIATRELHWLPEAGRELLAEIPELTLTDLTPAPKPGAPWSAAGAQRRMTPRELTWCAIMPIDLRR